MCYKGKFMNKLFRFYMMLGIIIFFSLPVSAKLPDRPFLWADDEDYKPLIYRATDGKSKGVFYELLMEAFKRMKIPLQNQLYPWSRTQKVLKEGNADGMVTVYTKARQKIFLATEPVVVVEEHVFTSKQNPKLHKIFNIHALDGLKEFVIVDTMGSGWSKENLKGMHIIWVPTSQSALNMVASLRADIYLLNNFTGPYFIQKQIQKEAPLYKQLKEIVMGDYPITTMTYQLLIRKGSPYINIIPRFNEVLHQMHEDGTYKRILEKYKIDMTYKPAREKSCIKQ